MDKIEETVIKNFIRTVKSDGLLPLVMRQLKIGFPLIEFYKSRYGKSSIRLSSVFSECKDIEDMANIVRQINKTFKTSDFNFENDDYAKVNMCINHLIHYLLERFVNQNKAQEIGEKLYYESCIELFGRVDEKKEDELPADEKDCGTPLNTQNIIESLKNFNINISDAFNWDSIYTVDAYDQMFNGGVMLGADVNQNE